MAVYLVAWELQQEDADYREFEAAIESYDSKPMLDRVHLIKAPTDADTLHKHLAALAGPEDRIWVSRVTEDHSGYVLAPAAEWLEKHRPL